MKIKTAGGAKESGIVVGNIYDKYGSSNQVVKWIMKGFESSLSSLVSKSLPKTIHEIGCGEGYWVLRWNEMGMSARGSDFSKNVIELAKKNAEVRGFSPSIFESRSIYNLEKDKDSADLVVSCEVLEHLSTLRQDCRHCRE